VAFFDLCDVIRRLIFVLLILSPLPIQAQTKYQFWTEADVYAWLTRNLRLLGMVQTIRDQYNGELDLFAGGFVDVGLKPILRERLDQIDWDATPMDYLRLRFGAAYLTPVNLEGASHELRLIADLTPRFRTVENILIAVRNRTEFRFVDGEYSFRYRPRLWIERSLFDVAGMTVTPYISVEAFYDSRMSAFTRQLSLIGSAVAITHWFAPELQLVYQRDWVGDGETLLAVDLVLAFYL